MILFSYTVIGGCVKIEALSEKKIILFLIDKNSFDFKNMKSLEEEFRKLFLKLKYYHDIHIQGFYNVKVYLDKNFGLVLEIDGEDLDYLDYLDGEIDMRIELIEEEFLYEVKDILNVPKYLRNKMDIYSLEDKYYMKVKEELNNIDLSCLLEYATCIYHNQNPFLLKNKYKIEC